MNLCRTVVGLLGGCLIGAACLPVLAAADVAVDVAVSLQDAVKQGKVEVQISALGGATGNTIRVDVQRKVPQKIRIKITPGTVFIAKGGKVQNMTGGTVKGEFIRGKTLRRTSVIVLADGAKHSYVVESFCLDYHKPAPKRSHSFSLALTDQRASRILKAPKEKSASVWAFQCALWMDRAGVSAAELKKRFPRHVTDVEVRVARDMLRHAEKTGVAGIPEGISIDVRVEVEKLFSSRPEVRVQAVKRLGGMGRQAAPALPLVAVNVIDPQTGTTRVSVPAARAEAAEWLEALGLSGLAPFLRGPDGAVGAGGALDAIRSVRLQRLTANLKHANWRVRQRSARVLGTIQQTGAVEPLIAALKDQDSRVQAEAAAALSKITGKDFGQDHGKWETWWQKNKSAFLEGG